MKRITGNADIISVYTDDTMDIRLEAGGWVYGITNPYGLDADSYGSGWVEINEQNQLVNIFPIEEEPEDCWEPDSFRSLGLRASDYYAA